MPVSRAILCAALVVGVLDATDGVVFLGLHGQNPIPVLQYIASSLLGVRSFSRGLAIAGLGHRSALRHFASSCNDLYSCEPAHRCFRAKWVLLGLLYGAAVGAVMNLVMLPLTAVAHGPITTAALVNGVMGHALFVGLPSAFFAKVGAAE